MSPRECNSRSQASTPLEASDSTDVSFVSSATRITASAPASQPTEVTPHEQMPHIMLRTDKNRPENIWGDGEISDLNRNIAFSKLGDGVRESPPSSTRAPKISSELQTLENNTEKKINIAPEESTSSRYPKRKRPPILNDSTESKLEIVHTTETEIAPTSRAGTNKLKRNRQTLANTGVKGVVLGVWRYSSVPDNQRKHAAIGFIDVSGRLRTRIRPHTKQGESLVEDYPLPPGAGKFWASFERIIFSDHLVGLNYFQVKEYTRLRSEAAQEHEDDLVAVEHAAVQKVIRLFKNDAALENSENPPAIAYGVEMQQHLQVPTRLNLERSCVSGGLPAVYRAPLETAPEPDAIPTPGQSITANQTQLMIDPLPGTRTTQILIGHWKLSSEVNPKDRHAIYGILGQNDILRVKAINQTRDGRHINGVFANARFMDGNYSHGAGGLWIPYEEVELEPHLKALNKQEVKEYCRVRQNQLDHGEVSTECIENETKAVYEAQVRAGTAFYVQPRDITGYTSTASPQDGGGKRYSDGVPCQSRGPEPRSIQAVAGEDDWQPSGPPDVQDTEIARALAHREIAGAKAGKYRAIGHAICRERAMAAAAAAADTSLKRYLKANGSIPPRRSSDMQRLNDISAQQETLRTKSGSVVKMYGGYKYERKMAGPFVGKLVSQGTVINIDGDDYVEYRVLTKPSFF